MNPDFVEFYKRWFVKVSEYDVDVLSECFDKFVTLFILFNFQYSFIAREKGVANKDGWFKDKDMATSRIIDYIPTEDFCSCKIVIDSVEKICSLVEGDYFCIHYDRNRNRDRDRELMNKIRSTNLEQKCKGILEMLYFIRCNLFHGQKSFTENQKSILIPCIKILEVLNKLIFRSMLDDI
jgi:hypothetical protein